MSIGCCSIVNVVFFRLLGALLTLSPDYSFVVEDELGVCGYLAATLHAKSFWKKYEVAYLPEMREKYMKPDTDSKDINEAEVRMSIPLFETQNSN